jgi:uncharacterized membrane protein
MTVVLTVGLAVTLVLTGLMAGVFFTYSNSVTPGLDALEPRQALAAMLSMNQKILNPAFLTMFVTAPLAGAATGVLLLLSGNKTAGILLLSAAAAYFLGSFVPTMAVNVPMNEALAAGWAAGETADPAKLWTEFSARWTSWNTLRAWASTLSLLLVGSGIASWVRSGW